MTAGSQFEVEEPLKTHPGLAIRTITIRAMTGALLGSVAESRAEHDRLELQHAVGEPEQAERSLQTPPGEVRPAQPQAHGAGEYACRTCAGAVLMTGREITHACRFATRG